MEIHPEPQAQALPPLPATQLKNHQVKLTMSPAGQAVRGGPLWSSPKGKIDW